MGTETERRFLVHYEVFIDENRTLPPGDLIVQGYLSTDPAVRVRTVNDCAGFITIKGPKNNGCGEEYEYAVPFDDAVSMLSLCSSRIMKIRHTLPAASPARFWEVDIFMGENSGLVIAEIELDDINEPIEFPSWLNWKFGKPGEITPNEITQDHRYSNSSLSINPYSTFKN